MFDPFTSHHLVLQQLIRQAAANDGQMTDRSEGRASVQRPEVFNVDGAHWPLELHVRTNAEFFRTHCPNRALKGDGRVIQDTERSPTKCLTGSDIWHSLVLPQAYRPDGLAAPIDMDETTDSICGEWNVGRVEFERFYDRFQSSPGYNTACQLTASMANYGSEDMVISGFRSIGCFVTLGAFGFAFSNESWDRKFGLQGLLPYVEGNDAVSAANLKTNVGYESTVDIVNCRPDRAAYAIGEAKCSPLRADHVNFKWYERTTCCGQVICGLGGCPSARIGYALVNWGFVFYHRRLVSSLEAGEQRFVYGLVSDNDRFIRFAQLPNEPNPEVILQNRHKFFRFILLISLPGLSDSQRALVGLSPLNQAFYTPASEAEVVHHEGIPHLGSPTHHQATANRQYDHGAHAAFMSGLDNMAHEAVNSDGEPILRLTAVRNLSDDFEEGSSSDSGISERGDLDYDERPFKRIQRYGPIHYAAPASSFSPRVRAK